MIEKKPTERQIKFLRELHRWNGDGAATSLELSNFYTCGRADPEDLRNRQSCKRRGWVTFDGYWRLTDEGRKVLAQ